MEVHILDSCSAFHLAKRQGVVAPKADRETADTSKRWNSVHGEGSRWHLRTQAAETCRGANGMEIRNGIWVSKAHCFRSCSGILVLVPASYSHALSHVQQGKMKSRGKGQCLFFCVNRFHYSKFRKGEESPIKGN